MVDLLQCLRSQTFVVDPEFPVEIPGTRLQSLEISLRITRHFDHDFEDGAYLAPVVADILDRHRAQIKGAKGTIDPPVSSSGRYQDTAKLGHLTIPSCLSHYEDPDWWEDLAVGVYIAPCGCTDPAARVFGTDSEEDDSDSDSDSQESSLASE